jgi:hypothetical protein
METNNIYRITTAKKPDAGGTRINDKEVLPVIDKLVYGYEKCVLMNQHRDDTIFIAQGASPLTRADCPTILAKGERRL